MRNAFRAAALWCAAWVPGAAFATEARLPLTGNPVGYTVIAVFIIAYVFVALEEFTHLRKSKPVLLAAGIIWALIAAEYTRHGLGAAAEQAARRNLLEYAELMLFLLVAMTYVNSMEERRVFDWLRAWMIRRHFSLRQVFWITGTLAFFISPIADNLTTALLMCAVVIAVGRDERGFVVASCVNIVVAANAGGAFSPFGDITTLMVWQKQVVPFWDFFRLFVPAAVNFLVPAAIMHFAVPNHQPDAPTETVLLKRGAVGVIILFLLTIVTAVGFHNFLSLPPVLGMLTGLAYLQLYGYYLQQTFDPIYLARKYSLSEEQVLEYARVGSMVPFDIFARLARAEWDTLLFFYGVVMCVGGLGLLGYLALASQFLYTGLGATVANIGVGAVSSIVDNIPVMYAVLTMNPSMSQGQWLLVTLTTGVGGSLLSIGSAAGVALMGQARGSYTFMSHLRWTPAIALGYAASILVHLWLNQGLF